MKRIIISEEQARLINESELQAEKNVTPPSFLMGENNPLSTTGYFVGNVLDRMAKRRVSEIADFFIDDISSFDKDKVYSKLSRLISVCSKKEEPIRNDLEKICSNAVVEMFGIPADSLKINCELVGDIPPGEQFNIKPDTDENFEYDSIEAMNSSDAEINKRRIINALSYGAANRISEQTKKEWLSDVFNLDEDLPHLYSQIMKINEYLVFNTDIEIEDKSHKQGGTVEVRLSREDELTELSARGITFPILLHEMIRGVAELIASYGLPDDEEEARRITNIADALENDPWNMRFGPAMWDCVCAGIGEIDASDFPFFFKKLVSLNTSEFETTMKEVFAGTKAGREAMNSIYAQSKYENEYDRFTQDLAVKRERNVIEDDYFTEEELEEGVYGDDE